MYILFLWFTVTRKDYLKQLLISITISNIYLDLFLTKSLNYKVKAFILSSPLYKLPTSTSHMYFTYNCTVILLVSYFTMCCWAILQPCVPQASEQVSASIPDLKGDGVAAFSYTFLKTDT